MARIDVWVKMDDEKHSQIIYDSRLRFNGIVQEPLDWVMMGLNDHPKIFYIHPKIAYSFNKRKS